MTDSNDKLSIIIPACNEAEGLAIILPELKKTYPHAEILVVNDGSTDSTEDVCRQNSVLIITHPYRMGNGAAVKAGARAATGDFLAFMDADGQHAPSDLKLLVEKMEQGYDMVVGARPIDNHANPLRLLGNIIYNKLASWMTSQTISDLTSGFRVVKADKFREFLYLLPNGFSYPTTITMAFFRTGYSVGYVPIKLGDLLGDSHIKLMKDGVKFILIILRVGTLYSPLKIFFPTSMIFFLLGIGYYAYTYSTENRFTNMSALLFIISVMVFLIGLISEQVTSLIYQRKG